ncbi:hypothetical protein GCM10010363_31060 [Streptomyces omiyaensis]|nr:hypothetical protein GCM10010363_31060 [Streptomyces omiyaensis]
MPQREVAEATLLMRELTTRRHETPAQSMHVGRARVSLFAPLRRLRRTLFGARH